MTILGDLDLGGRPIVLQPHDDGLDASFWISARLGLGGQQALSLGALRLLRNQLREMATNSRWPVYCQWTATADPGAMYPSRADPLDGWYSLHGFEPDFESYNGAGSIQAKLSAAPVAPTSPSSLAAFYAGGAMSSSYSATATPLVSFPIGSTLQAPTASTRTGGEGAIPISVPAVGGVNPVPFVRPGTIAGLYTGGIRVYDTINTSSYPVP